VTASGITACRNDDNTVELAGVVEDAATKVGEVIHVLPPDLRPSCRVDIMSPREPTHITVTPDGEVKLAGLFPPGRDRATVNGVRFSTR